MLSPFFVTRVQAAGLCCWARFQGKIKVAEGEGEGTIEARAQRCKCSSHGNLQKLGIRRAVKKWRAHRGLDLELVVGEGDNGRAREQRGNQEKFAHGGGANSLWFEIRKEWVEVAESGSNSAVSETARAEPRRARGGGSTKTLAVSPELRIPHGTRLDFDYRRRAGQTFARCTSLPAQTRVLPVSLLIVRPRLLAHSSRLEI
jgi:hypothetical protein